MKFRAYVVAMVVGAVLMPCFAVQAAAAELTVKASTKDDLTAAADAVHKQMAAGGRYEFVTTAERGEIDAKLSEMQAIFDHNGSVSTMNQDTKVRLYNDQEAVNAILTKRDSDRRICKSESATGSLIPKTSCRTYGEIASSQRQSERYLQDTKLIGHYGSERNFTLNPNLGGGH